MPKDPVTEADDAEIRAYVRKHYAEAVGAGGSCCGPAVALESVKGTLAKLTNYSDEELSALPADAVTNSFGCGNPLAFAEVRAGQTVLDIGSGAGIDVFLAARKVGPTGLVIGVDMTPEMVDRARANAAEAGIANVQFRLGEAEHLPAADNSVDWVISNCVINLAPDKDQVFGEICRVLRPGGRVSVSDIVTSGLPEQVTSLMQAWANCVGGALPEEEYLAKMRAAGLADVSVTERAVYDATTITSLIAEGSGCCGTAGLPMEAVQPIARAVAGKVWSAKVSAHKPE